MAKAREFRRVAPGGAVGRGPMQANCFGHRGNSGSTDSPHGRGGGSQSSRATAPNSASDSFDKEACRLLGPIRSSKRHGHRSAMPGRKVCIRHSLRGLSWNTRLLSFHRKRRVVWSYVSPAISANPLVGGMVAARHSKFKRMERWNPGDVANMADVLSGAFPREWR